MPLEAAASSRTDSQISTALAFVSISVRIQSKWCDIPMLCHSGARQGAGTSEAFLLKQPRALQLHRAMLLHHECWMNALLSRTHAQSMLSVQNLLVQRGWTYIETSSPSAKLPEACQRQVPTPCTAPATGLVHNKDATVYIPPRVQAQHYISISSIDNSFLRQI